MCLLFFLIIVHLNDIILFLSFLLWQRYITMYRTGSVVVLLERWPSWGRPCGWRGCVSLNMLSSPAEGGQWLLSQDGRAAQTWNGNLSSPLGGYALWLSTIFHSKALFDVATVFDLFSPFKPEADCFWPAATACLADFRSSALFDVCCSLHASPGTLAAWAWSWDEQITH